jgi:hypothetical protein
MTTKTLSDCAQCPRLVNCDAHITGGVHKHQEEPDHCAPIIDAEKSNEALQLLARIRTIR